MKRIHFTVLLVLFISQLAIGKCHMLANVVVDGDASKRVYVDGKVIIGALFPLHHKPAATGSGMDDVKTCGKIWEQYGIQRVEAFLLILEQINSDPSLLPNITLGCDIRDTCWYTPKALEECKDFIRNSLLSLEPASFLRSNASLPKPIAGLIGPGSSSVTEDVQNMLSLFQIPEIGYSATSITLTNSDLYPTFVRVVSPDSQQAQALASFVQTFHWQYVSLVSTDGTYGSKGKQQLRKYLEELNICVAADESVEELTADRLNQVVQVLLNHKASVIICFCEGLTVKNLLSALQRNGVQDQFTLIGSDGWNTRQDVVQGQEDVARGSFSVQLDSAPLHGFDEHYHSLNPYNHTVNPWFREFWEEKFDCTLGEGEEGNSSLCSADLDLSQDYIVDGKLGFVADALYTMAYALDSMAKKLCPEREDLCSAMTPINGSLLYEFLLQVNFTTYSGKQLYFDNAGDPPGKYQFMNYQKFANGSHGYVQIGTWENKRLDVNADIQWKADRGVQPESVCSTECPLGSAKRKQPGAADCCWFCEKCQPDSILSNGSCVHCEQGWWPDSNLTECLFIEVQFTEWTEVSALLPFCTALIGIILAVATMTMFIRQNRTAIVKASTRELTYMILIGIILAYISTLTFILKPSPFSCCMTRMLPGLSFSLIYGSVLTNTNRIARILASGKKIIIKKPRCMTTNSLVAITMLLVFLECSIISALLIWYPPETEVIHPTPQTARLQCRMNIYSLLGPFSIDFLLVALCTFYAVKTRNVPANFNEAKFIGFTMYVTCVIWIAFVPIYFGSDSKIVTITMCITLSATVALIFLFWPKAYIMMMHPERNHRGAFTTTSDIRCHVGRSPPVYPQVNQNRNKNNRFVKSMKNRLLGPSISLDQSTAESYSEPHTIILDSLSNVESSDRASFRNHSARSTRRSVATQADLCSKCHAGVKRQMSTKSTKSKRSRTDISSEGSCSSHGRYHGFDLTDLEESDAESFDDHQQQNSLVSSNNEIQDSCAQLMNKHSCTEDEKLSAVPLWHSRQSEIITTETGSDLSLAIPTQSKRNRMSIWNVLKSPFFLARLRKMSKPQKIKVRTSSTPSCVSSSCSDPTYSSDPCFSDEEVMGGEDTPPDILSMTSTDPYSLELDRGFKEYHDPLICSCGLTLDSHRTTDL